VGLKGFKLPLVASKTTKRSQSNEDYERIVLMPLVDKKIGLALMSEDLVKQGVVKKHRARRDESMRLD
jgi:hypothetical protein